MRPEHKILLSLRFFNISSRLTHRKHLIQRALHSPDPGKCFQYIEHGWEMRQKFLEAFKVKNFTHNSTRVI